LNYYEKHLGDYLKNAAHLSLLEHGVYSRLMDVYYVQEAAIPAAKAARLIAARSKEEIAALDLVLQEFFELRADGCWHQSRCDEDIAAYQDGEPEREVKKANEDNRTRRHREERARLFKVITDAGEHAAWNAPIADIRAMAARIQGAKPATPAPAPETVRPEEPATPVTAPATPVTATQTPDTRTQSPATNPQTPEGKTQEQGADGPAQVTPTRAGSACLALRRAGISDGSTSHPKLLTLLAQGVTDDELVDAANAAISAKKPKFAYVLGVVEGRRKDAAAVGTLAPAAPRTNRQQALEDSNRAVGQAWAAGDNTGDDDATR
jgi:uncharacterized protein YdaU (DUF1376 family)